VDFLILSLDAVKSESLAFPSWMLFSLADRTFSCYGGEDTDFRVAAEIFPKFAPLPYNSWLFGVSTLLRRVNPPLWIFIKTNYHIRVETTTPAFLTEFFRLSWATPGRQRAQRGPCFSMPAGIF
jgi:hypothetical protein